MSTHHLDNDDLYLKSSGKEKIMIGTVTNPGKVVGNYKEWKTVDPRNDTLKVNDVEIFGCRLAELEANLKKYNMYVNRQGYCYVSIPYCEGTLLRMNDFFNWSKYYVVPKITTIWSRCELNTNTVVIDYQKKEKEFADMERNLYCLTEKLQLKDRDLMEKDKSIAEKDEQLKEKKAELKDLELQLKDKIIAEKDVQLREMKLQLKDKNIAEEYEQLREMKAEFKDMTRELRRLSERSQAAMKRYDEGTPSAGQGP